jgi:hypothetical protein
MSKHLGKNCVFDGCASVNTMGHFQDTLPTLKQICASKFEVLHIHHINYHFINNQTIKYNWLTLCQP